MAELASGKLILDEPDPGVARLRIHNEERRGALDHEILDTLAETVAELDARCLLLTGTGPVFSAGYDLGNLEGREFEENAEKLVAHPFHSALEALEAFPYPVVAALNGHAIGGGLELALTCDIRIAATGIKLGMPPAKLGLIYGHTGLERFMDVVGVAGTRDLFLTGRVVDSERALRTGLVHELAADDELADLAVTLASEIAGNAPLSMKGNKHAIEMLARKSRLSAAVERELVELRESCFASEDFREGVTAFAEKRKPVWHGH
jgi:enoyl-CoA hydratase/carnithine racemase